MDPEIARLFAAKEARRRRLARLPFAEKVKLVVQLQRMAAPLLLANAASKSAFGISKEPFRTLAGREHRGCFGKSSGGYGAIIHGMKYAKYWGAVAGHSGDACFDFVYWHDWPNTLNEL
jgi:hypothetical protein